MAVKENVSMCVELFRISFPMLHDFWLAADNMKGCLWHVGGALADHFRSSKSDSVEVTGIADVMSETLPLQMLCLEGKQLLRIDCQRCIRTESSNHDFSTWQFGAQFCCERVGRDDDPSEPFVGDKPSEQPLPETSFCQRPQAVHFVDDRYVTGDEQQFADRQPAVYEIGAESAQLRTMMQADK